MNVVDSSAWLAYFADEPSAKNFHTPIQNIDELIVPVVTVYEVFKVVLRETSENEALQVVAAMQKGTVVNLTTKLAINASKLSLMHKLPMFKDCPRMDLSVAKNLERRLINIPSSASIGRTRV